MVSKSCGLATISTSETVLRRWLLGLALIAVAILTAVWSPAVTACNTPVYRYAMYNWQTAPYIVFYFHDGEVAEEDKAVHEAIEKLSEEWPPEANVRLELIDVSDEKKMEGLPEFVIEAWKSHEDGKLPAHVIFAPWRANVYSGRLDAESVKKLVDSPARQQFGKLLGEGNAAVMILLTCADEEQNKKAEEALKGLRKLADSGEIPVELELPPMGLPGEDAEGEDSEEEADPNKLGISVLKVKRDDPAEEFFVRMLMSVEEDLEEYADQPMIFAGYGRGRAMEPYIGKGITPENLVDVVAFLAGACSCMVKEQNPGADLLVKWNWEETADKMAENDSTLDYGPYGPEGYGEFPAEPGMADDDAEEASGEDAEGPAEEPTEVAAADAPPAAAEETETAVADATATETTPSEEPAPAEEVAMSDPAPAAEPAPEAPPTEPEDVTSDPAAAVAEADQPTVSEPPMTSSESAAQGAAESTTSFVRGRMLTYGLGFGAIALGVLLAGLALVVRRS